MLDDCATMILNPAILRKPLGIDAKSFIGESYSYITITYPLIKGL